MREEPPCTDFERLRVRYVEQRFPADGKNTFARIVELMFKKNQSDEEGEEQMILIPHSEMRECCNDEEWHRLQNRIRETSQHCRKGTQLLCSYHIGSRGSMRVEFTEMLQFPSW